jgi:hypothetical protein
MEGGYKRPIHSSLHDVDDREWIWRKKRSGSKENENDSRESRGRTGKPDGFDGESETRDKRNAPWQAMPVSRMTNTAYRFSKLTVFLSQFGVRAWGPTQRLQVQRTATTELLP